MSLSVRFQHRFPALELEIEFEAPTPGVTVLFGPSGCGKSLTVAVAAGLFRPDRCRVELDGTALVDTEQRIDVPAERRRIGMVFQDSRLFPHMTALGNLRYGARRAPPGQIKLDDVVELLGIRALLGRRPGRLSGGERQRVAIGRALLSQPRLLAMDEPLASLDAPRKAEILPFLNRLKSALALPILYVTHSPEELATLGDTLVLMQRGRVLASGPLERLVSRGDLPIAARDDAGAVLPVEVVAHHDKRRLTELASGAARIFVPMLDAAPGERLRVRVPAREVVLAIAPVGRSSVHNVLPARVAGITTDAQGHAALVELDLPDARLLARVTEDAVVELGLQLGSAVVALVKSVSIDVLPH